MPLFFNLSSWKIATIDILNQNSKLFNVREEKKKKRRKFLAMINSGWLLYKWPFFSGFFYDCEVLKVVYYKDNIFFNGKFNGIVRMFYIENYLDSLIMFNNLLSDSFMGA